VNINLKQRSPQSKMLLVLALGTAIGILPFAIFRVLESDWYVAILDFLVVIGMSVIFIYVYKTDNVKNASLVLILVALIANVVSFYLKGISQIGWIYPAMLSAYYIMSPKKGMIVNFVMLSLYLPKLFQLLEVVNIATIVITIVITNVIAYVFASGLRQQEKFLKKLASEDYLTSTGNRRFLDTELSNLHKKLQNHDRTASIVLLDLDHFKKVNDTHGHLKGDEVLIRLSELLKCYYKTNESVFRYGGEEFLVICPGKSITEVGKMANEFREIVKKNIIIDDVEQTISLGVAEYIKEESIDDWISRVDLALYQAKNEGRDRVVQA
jgi:diguanylate cyclase (GGDEF)-like protein